MHPGLQRKTVYAGTIIALLAISGGWAFAVGTTQVAGPSQSSTVVITTPTGFSLATVSSLNQMGVSTALAGNTPLAGTQATGSNGLNSSGSSTVAYTIELTCTTGYCQYPYTAIQTAAPTATLNVGDLAEQVELSVADTTPAALGFDAQVGVTLSTGTLVFGNAYFATAVLPAGVTAGSVSVFLYLDLGVAFNVMDGPTVSTVAVVFNTCNSALSCP